MPVADRGICFWLCPTLSSTLHALTDNALLRNPTVARGIGGDLCRHCPYQHCLPTTEGTKRCQKPDLFLRSVNTDDRPSRSGLTLSCLLRRRI